MKSGNGGKWKGGSKGSKKGSGSGGDDDDVRSRRLPPFPDCGKDAYLATSSIVLDTLATQSEASS